MDIPNIYPRTTEHLTESEEMYLLTVMRLSEGGEPTPISISNLADALHVQAVSVNQMVRKLEKTGWLSYIPYKGVTLTPQGQEHAQMVVHHRRLWQVFFVEKLGMDMDAADALACRMEHITTADVAKRLAEYLDHPAVNPLGYPIPDVSGASPLPHTIPLATCAVGDEVDIARIDADAAFSRQIDALGLSPGHHLKIIATDTNGCQMISHRAGFLTLHPDISQIIFVTKQQN
jgi:DtxR family Mn-dependent transcriptional regulator